MNKVTLLFFVFFYTITINATETPLFPTIDGWNKSKEIKLYDSESLWEYINGAADYYLNYGFEKLEVVEYAQSEDVYLKAEIYYHNNALNAFGIYAYERPEVGNFMNIGAEAYLAHSALNIYLGNYYIKIHSHNSSKETIETIKLLGKSIIKNLKTPTTAPSELMFLPTENRIEHTEKYTPNNYMGYSFFKNVINAKYKKEENKFELFCIKYDSEEAAKNSLQQYFNFIKLSTPLESDKIYEIDDTFNDKVFIVVSNSILYGVWNVSDENSAKEYLLKFLNK